MTPEELGVTPEFISPSLLVPKEEKDSWRLVSDFTDLNKIIKRDGSSNPTIQEAESDLAKKKYHIELDLSNFYFQSGMKRGDTAYLAVQHPFDGILCYTSAPQGLKNSAEQCYNLLARIYGQMMKEGKLTRMADSIFPLGDDFEELAKNYTEALRKAELCNMTFKPQKTIVAPRRSIIFGWQLHDGEWSPTGHVTSALSRAEKPNTFKQLRSFLGSFKQLNACIEGYAAILSPFEKIAASRTSAERIQWTDDLEDAFEKAKRAAANPKGVHVPRRSDKLVTSSDYSQSTKSVGGLLTVYHEEDGVKKTLLGGHFSCTLDKHKVKWSVCEAECFGVRVTTKHFEKEIRDSDSETLHLCDNIPTVLAWKNALIGKISTAKRIAAFLALMADLPIRLEHRPGSDLCITDQASRNPAKCDEVNCQICEFVKKEVAESDNFANILNITDDKSTQVPYLQLKTWAHIQANDSTHTRLTKLIKTGQSPLKKKTGGEETILKHLFNLFQKKMIKLDNSGVILVKSKGGHFDGYSISVPTSVFPALCFAFHNRNAHPSKTQMLKLISRYYFCTGMATTIEKISNSCLQCLATAKLPKEILADSTTIPDGIGTSFSYDVLERHLQRIMLTKEDLTHYASAVLLPDQTAMSLRQGLVQTIAPLAHPDGAKVREDNAPGFQSIIANQDTEDSEAETRPRRRYESGSKPDSGKWNCRIKT